MQHWPALACWSRFTNRRGAALLLTIYLTSLILLILGGVSLQRSTIESRAGQVSRDTQQAFYLAESGLDQALVALRSGQVLPEEDTQHPAGAGTFTYRIETIAAEVIPPGRERLTRQIVATGAVGDATRAVRATFVEERPFHGISAQGGVRLVGDYCGWNGNCAPAQPEPEDFLTINGTIRTAIGSAPSMHLERVRLNGSVSVGPPAPYLDRPAYTHLFGASYDVDAVYTGDVQSVLLSDQPEQVPLTVQPWTHAQFDALAQSPSAQSLADNPCRDGVDVGSWDTVEINDGHPCDLTGPGDNRIVLVTKYVFVHGNLMSPAYPEAEWATLKFDSPTTVYLTGRRTTVSGDWPLDMSNGYGAYYQGMNASVAAVRDGQTLADGVSVVIPDWAYEQRNFTWTSQGLWKDLAYEWDFHLAEGKFAGSIWAPQSHVFIEVPDAINPLQLQLSRIVSQEIWVNAWGNGEQLSFPEATSADQQDSAPIEVLSWTDERF